MEGGRHTATESHVTRQQASAIMIESHLSGRLSCKWCGCASARCVIKLSGFQSQGPVGNDVVVIAKVHSSRTSECFDDEIILVWTIFISL